MDNSKIMMIFLGVLAGGMLLVAYNRLTPELENSNYGGIMDRHKLNNYAQGICSKAVRSQQDIPLYTPTKIEEVNNGQAQLTWRKSAGAPLDVVCRYEEGKGIMQLEIDGKQLGAVKADISTDPGANAPGALTEKHWGHW